MQRLTSRRLHSCLAPSPLQSWEQQRAAAGGAARWAAAPRPPGLELKACLSGGDPRDTQAAYEALTQGLGGMLCAGIAVLPQLGVLAAPAVGWFGGQREPAVAAANRTAGCHVYGQLDQEGVCSENLGAWRRLLPCRAHAGLAALLRAPQLAAAPYHSQRLHVWVERAGAQPRLQLRQTLTAVLPLPSAAREGQGPLEALFGAERAPPACPAAASTALYVAAQQQGADADADSLSAAAAASGGACRAAVTAWGPLLVCSGALRALLSPRGVDGQQLEGRAVRVPPQVVQQVVPGGPLSGTLVVGVRVAEAAEAQLLHVLQLVPWQLQVEGASFGASLDQQVGGRRRSTSVGTPAFPLAEAPRRTVAQLAAAWSHPPPIRLPPLCAGAAARRPGAAVAGGGRAARPHRRAGAAAAPAARPRGRGARGPALAGGAAAGGLPLGVCGRV